MRICYLALALCFSLGCQGLSRRTPLQTVPEIAAPEKPMAIEGLRVVKHEETSTEDALSRAADFIQKGDLAEAAKQLKKHLGLFPQQIMIRAYLAELLLKANNLPEAQEQFEKFIADAQEANSPAKQQLLHCHTRLMEIGQQREDYYTEHLHRGIGMLLLVRQLDGNKGVDEIEPGFRERLLCKAAGELTKARKIRGDEPRPLCYLAEAWTKLNQPRSAAKALQLARERSTFLPLAAAEQRSLALAR